MNEQPQFEKLIDDAEVGKLLVLHPKTVQKLARAGEIPAHRIGRYWRYRATELNRRFELQSSGQLARVT